ncbi:hypothetical protein J3459_007884 [Metarhizium acridum]|nr:hypothetical protein J3459_007884 [Metarhizium acridum]
MYRDRRLTSPAHPLQISQREYAEDTVFWTLKSATQFSARRRTTSLFLASTPDKSPTAYTWIDNTPRVWDELKALLEKHQPSSIAINAHPEIAFSSGLHAGEYKPFPPRSARNGHLDSSSIPS